MWKIAALFLVSFGFSVLVDWAVSLRPRPKAEEVACECARCRKDLVVSEVLFEVEARGGYPSFSGSFGVVNLGVVV